MDSQASPIDRINALQKRILAGEDPSAEEMAEVISQLRSNRATISETATQKKKTRAAQSEPVDIAALFAKKKEEKGNESDSP